MLKGIDISKWQAGIDLSKIDTDFVICKATEGVGYTDKYCDKLYQQAKKLGKKLGVYHFARPDLGNTATAEADWFVRETKGYHKEAMLILDWESGDLGNVTWAKQWLDRVYQKTGVKPVIYMSASVMTSYNWSSVANADYGLWVANYGSNNGTAQESVFDRYPLKHWSFYALWQYTSKGRLSGYNGNLDLNFFTGDKSAWDKYAGGSPSSNTGTSKPSQPAKKSTDEIAREVINGKWGNGDVRENGLKAAGYNYQTIQNRVNEILGIDTVRYYKAFNNSSIVDGLKSIGVDSSFNNRKKIAAANGISNYSGTPAQNIKLLSLAKQGKLKKA